MNPSCPTELCLNAPEQMLKYLLLMFSTQLHGVMGAVKVENRYNVGAMVPYTWCPLWQQTPQGWELPPG